MRRNLVAPAALVGVLLVASSAWAPPPRPRPRPSTPTPSPAPSRPVPPAARPSVGGARATVGESFEAARARSAAEAAEVLRRQGALLARNQRAAMLAVVIHQTLRQKHPASLTELRHLRSDCGGVGPGVLDPIVLMELEAAESAAERVLLAEILRLIAAGRYAEAAEKIDHLESPRHLPAAAVQPLADLPAELKRAALLVRMRDLVNGAGEHKGSWRAAATAPANQLPPAVVRAAVRWSALDAADRLFGEAHTVEDIDRALKVVSRDAGAEVARKLRAELAARLLLSERPKDATRLLEGEVDPVHAAVVLADLRAAALGRGAFDVPQVAAAAGGKRPAVADAILPPARLANWQPPTVALGETTVNVALADAEGQLRAAVQAAAAASVEKVNALADRIRAALAAEEAPQKAFLDKVAAFRGAPLSTPVEVQLAVMAATRGLTVAEAVGVLASDADRPRAAARLLATVPAMASPAAFAAAVEVSGRAPAAFADRPDAGFKLVAAPTRARLRDAVGAALGAYGQKVANGQSPDPPTRAELEADVTRRLGAPGAVPPAEVVQALLDTCRDGADDHARLSDAARALDDVIEQIEEARRDEDDRELQDAFAVAKARRIGVQFDRKRAGAVVTAGCGLLGAYGSEAQPAAAWLAAQEEGKPWRAAAGAAGAKIAEGK